MDLNEVATFVRVVETGSFSKAAELLGVPRSTVSRRVARLEKNLGVRLLRRTTRSMRLTPHGQEYYNRVSPAVGTIQGAGDIARDQVGEVRGTLRITAVPDFAQDYLPAICADFLKQYPQVRLQVDLSGRVVDMVEEGFDLAIRGGRLPDSTLVARRIAQTNLQLFASPDYVAQYGAPETPQDLTAHKCIIFQTTAPTQRWRLQDSSGHEVSVVVEGVAESNDYNFVRRAVAAGVGIALMPAFLAHSQEHLSLERVLPEWQTIAGSISVVIPSGQYVPAKTRAFQRVLLEHLSPLPWER